MTTYIITKQQKKNLRENKRRKKSCLETLMFDPWLEPLVFLMNNNECQSHYL